MHLFYDINTIHRQEFASIAYLLRTIYLCLGYAYDAICNFNTS